MESGKCLRKWKRLISVGGDSVAQRSSGYQRKRNDAYYTPAWVTRALLPHIPPQVKAIWEPACGRGAIVSELRIGGYGVVATDLKDGQNFLDQEFLIEAVITNPPYGLAEEFITHALIMTRAHLGFVAMLLSTDFDHAKRRRHLFGRCPQFAKKLVLTKRIVWFNPVVASPSSNHGWFCWDWQHRGPPVLEYYYENQDEAPKRSHRAD